MTPLKNLIEWAKANGCMIPPEKFEELMKTIHPDPYMGAGIIPDGFWVKAKREE